MTPLNAHQAIADSTTVSLGKKSEHDVRQEPSVPVAEKVARPKSAPVIRKPAWTAATVQNHHPQLGRSIVEHIPGGNQEEVPGDAEESESCDEKCSTYDEHRRSETCKQGPTTECAGAPKRLLERERDAVVRRQMREKAQREKETMELRLSSAFRASKVMQSKP